MDYKIDDLVWAKMSKFRHWPARIIKPDYSIKTPKSKEDCQFVVFFGTNDVAWIQNENIIPHSDDVFQSEIAKKGNKGFQFALNDFKSYLALPLGIPEKPRIKKEGEKRKIKPARESADKQDQSSPKRKVVKIFETGPKKHERNVLSQKSGFKRKVSKKQPVNGERIANSPTTSDKFGTSMDSSLDRRHSFERGESSKIATVDKKHSIEQDLALFNFQMEQSLDDTNQTGTSDAMDVSEQPVISFDKKYGFLGLSDLGRLVLKKFINSGMDMTLWDDGGKYEEFTTTEKKVKIAQSPSELIHKCDIVFCCYESDSDAFENIIHYQDGILKGFEEAEKLERRPGYVGLARVDLETSKLIQEKIATKNGMYLDAPINRSDNTIETRDFIINAAGDRDLFSECEKCFKIITKRYFFMGYDISINFNLNMVYNATSSTVTAAVAEAFILLRRLKLLERKNTVHDVLPTMVEFHGILDKVDQMGDFKSKTITPLKKVQSDLSLVLSLADALSQRLPLCAAANERYKYAKVLNYSDSDVSEIYKAVKY